MDKTELVGAATITTRGTLVDDSRPDPADHGEYLVSEGDTFTGNATQTVNDKSLSRNGTFTGASQQYLNGDNDSRKAIALDSTFTGDKTTGQRAGQTVNNHGLAIDSKFDYADQTINTGGVAKGNTIKDGDQVVKGTAEKPISLMVIRPLVPAAKPPQTVSIIPPAHTAIRQSAAQQLTTH